jgi:hypothetical protein
MSFARFSATSDVYVFAHVDDYVNCCGCALEGDSQLHSPEEVVEHLQKHVEAGHKVPADLLELDFYEPSDFGPTPTTPAEKEIL